MKKHSSFLFLTCLWSLVFGFWSVPVFANNLSISNVQMKERDTVNDTLIVQFDISWDNSWRNSINHDAAWIIVKANASDALPYPHCQMKNAGTNPSGSSMGSDTNLEIYVPQDRMGAFLRASDYRAINSVSSTSVKVKIDYNSCGMGDSTNFIPYVFGTEMVFIPQGAFYVGDFSTGSHSLIQGGTDTDPWYISSEATIFTTSGASDGYRYVTGGNAVESASGSIFTIPTLYPKGYQPFYCMKYEITEGQWVDFFNTLSTAQRVNRDITNTQNGGKGSDAAVSRNTVAWDSLNPTSLATTTRSDRAMSYLSWIELSAFLDWAALRPMTELEFEKAARGPRIPVPGEYAWGATDIIKAVTLSAAESGVETITTTDAVTGAYAAYGSTTYVNGDASKGPLRVGIFAAGSTTRAGAGAGYYGVMELTGNMQEFVVQTLLSEASKTSRASINDRAFERSAGLG